MKTLLFGAKASTLETELAKHPSLSLVTENPDVVISYGGDGTLLTAERLYPGVPKVPIRNSRRGNRTLHHPPGEVMERLARGELVPMEFIKLQGTLYRDGATEPVVKLIAMNEFNVHMAHVNTAVRFRVEIDHEPYADGREFVGDGVLVSTPFGSTAYFNHVTRGLFFRGLGVAFNHVAEHTTHLVLPEECTVRIELTRGPALLAYDSAPEYYELAEGDVIVAGKAPVPATILTWGVSSRHPSQSF
jgi:NAD+ kinase